MHLNYGQPQEKPELLIKSASGMLEKSCHQAFVNLVADGMRLTDWITADYPNHIKDYYTKYVPGIFTNEREILVGYIKDEPVAVVILKKTSDELKISTLYVVRGLQGNGIATKILECAFKWLGTTKPLATLAEYKAEQFQGIIKRYGWTQTQILEQGYYNNRHREYVYNGEF